MIKFFALTFLLCALAFLALADGEKFKLLNDFKTTVVS
jgi:hypothetical protein